MQWNDILKVSHVKNIKQIWQLYVFICLLLLPLLPLFAWPLLPTHCGGRRLLFRRITLNDTHAAEVSWTSDRPVAETSTWQHTTFTRDKTPMPPVEFEPSISASERLQTHALDGAATWTGHLFRTSKITFPICILWLLSLAWDMFEC